MSDTGQTASMTRRAAIGTMAMTSVAAAQPAIGAPRLAGKLSVTVRSPRFLPNAVALTSTGTIFLGMPRWTGMEATPSVVRVAEDGSLVPFPGGSWNSWTPGADVRHAFIQINAIHIFGDDTLWVVDQGTADRKTTLPGAQKLLQFDTQSGKLLRALRFGPDILPAGAHMNDVRMWGSFIYVTDSGLGGIIVHNLATGQTLRRLSGAKVMKQAPHLPMRGFRRQVMQDRAGKRPDVGSDMIEVSPDGRWLYFATPTGPFHRIPTALLGDPTVADTKLAAAVEEVTMIPTLNGTAMDTLGNLYLADAENRRIEVVAPSGRRAVLVADQRLVGADAIFIDQQRRLHVPATQNERLPDHAEGRDLIERPFLVFSMPLPESVDGIRLGSAIAPFLATETSTDHPAARGIEHIGFTVPDHDLAVRFFEQAFGAKILYSLVRKGDAPMGADALGSKNGLADGTSIVALSLLRLRNGPNVEIFEIANAKGDPGRGISDFGISHFSIAVDDMEAVTSQFADAGGTLLDGPYDLTGPEAGAGNRGRFGRTPWGLLIEFESFGAPLGYEGTAVRWFPR